MMLNRGTWRPIRPIVQNFRLENLLHTAKLFFYRQRYRYFGAQ